MRRPLILVLILLVALCTTAVGLFLSGEPTGDLESSASASSLATMEASLFLPASVDCPNPVPSTTCTFAGECCRCGCSVAGKCVALGGHLLCLCSCSQ